MVERPTSNRRRATLGALALASAACVGLVAARRLHAGFSDYGFLLWNLFLAWIPFGLALLVYDGARRGRSTRWLLAVGTLWLLFLPNAPYIVTDFVHLGHHWEHPGAPIWFDATMIAAFAGTGLLLGFLSLSLVQLVVARRVGGRAAWGFALAALGLTSVGIYLGRVLRFNSWDALVAPHALLDALWAPLADPYAHRKVLAALVATTLALAVTYAVLHALGWLRPVEDEPREG
ncbi:MAG: DUF1361 domain-containing protein [Thermoleophilia bacterium]